MADSKKLLLIDGNSITFRGFYALFMQTERFVNHEGIHTSAVYSFKLMLDKMLADIRPDKVLVAFDAGKRTFRTEKYSDYKAGRKKTPEELLEQLQKYLDRTEREGMITRELLVALRTDLTQVVYAWLSEREIKAYALFADADMENLHRNSLYGREEMMEYAGVLVRKAVQYRQYINKSDSVTSQVCAYIDAHYREEIHREELGELVFLNTDYLSRIFKKEKGISISNYIIQKRVEEAKKLLTQSTLPINTVSLYVGYSNFSYFTKMFKDNTGYAPLEYRRSFSEK